MEREYQIQHPAYVVGKEGRHGHHFLVHPSIFCSGHSRPFFLGLPVRPTYDLLGQTEP